MEIPSTTPLQVTSQGKSVSALHGASSQPGQGRLGVVGVDRSQAPAVPGIERLQEIGGLAAPDLADNNVIGAMAQAHGLHEVPDRHRFAVDPPRLEADTVFPVDPEFQGVLDGNNAVVGGKQLDQGIEQRGLTRSGPAADQDIPPPQERGPCLVQHLYEAASRSAQDLRANSSACRIAGS